MERSEAIMKAFRNETKQMIFHYLLIYNELTLDQLSDLLDKSKSTIHHHMQYLLDIALIRETTKSGSKTIYYKLTTLRVDKIANELYERDTILALPNEPKQKKRFIEFLEYHESLLFIINSMLDLGRIEIKQILEAVNNKEMTITEGLDNLDDNISALYFASEDKALEFKKELRNLVLKYYDAESEKPDVIRPYSFVIYGLNSKDILDKRYNNRT